MSFGLGMAIASAVPGAVSSAMGMGRGGPAVGAVPGMGTIGGIGTGVGGGGIGFGRKADGSPIFLGDLIPEEYRHVEFKPMSAYKNNNVIEEPLPPPTLKEEDLSTILDLLSVLNII